MGKDFLDIHSRYVGSVLNIKIPGLVFSEDMAAGVADLEDSDPP